MADKIIQSNIDADGDVVGRDKIINNLILIKKDIPKAISPIREELGFELECDKNNTTLIKKLKDGKFNGNTKNNALRLKVKTVGLLLKMCKTESGKKAVADIYENLITLIDSKYICNMNDGDLLKTRMSEIYEEFNLLVVQFKSLINIDTAFLMGLLYVATSNCAIRWKVEDEM